MNENSNKKPKRGWKCAGIKQVILWFFARLESEIVQPKMAETFVCIVF